MVRSKGDEKALWGLWLGHSRPLTSRGCPQGTRVPSEAGAQQVVRAWLQTGEEAACRSRTGAVSMDGHPQGSVEEEAPSVIDGREGK